MLLQQIRDESHRFAIANNRKKKNRHSRKSKLDNIKGLGIKKKALLLKRFQSIKSIKAASLDELCSVAGISIKIAERIKQNLTLQ